MKAFFGVILSGFFILLPVVAVWLLLVETVAVVMEMGAPMAELIPGDFDANYPHLAKLVALLATCLLLGALARTGPGRRVGTAIEKAIFARMPGYKVIRTLSQRLAGAEEEMGFEPVLITQPDGTKQIVFRIEDHASGDATVFFPLSPTPGMGSVHIVPGDRLTHIDAPMMKVMDTIWHLGTGTKDVIGS